MNPASNPALETPPLVPGGTCLNVVIRYGFEVDKIPNSEDQVSAMTQVYWVIIPTVTLLDDSVVINLVFLDLISSLYFVAMVEVIKNVTIRINGKFEGGKE
ncbi:hypothetical protein WICPIJ_005100 [Wickerhamomyces pijperi]|uniref:Uncharacterized protein n=1 Tax=Wickerhamomyces pijperi TaxID=599730 RepID=A0A9P8TM91_WICPI|nr:hypothetical protein WICPIJ_005100 [Wickerhamomyces pijperi]